MDIERFNHAIALRDSGRVEEAQRELSLLSEAAADPGDRAALLTNQARCALLLSRTGEARRLVDSALKMAPRTEALLYIWLEDAVVRQREGRTEEALNILLGIEQEHGGVLSQPAHRELHGRVLAQAGLLLTHLGRCQEATAILERSVSVGVPDEEAGNVHYNLGRCYYKTGDYVRAEENLRKTIKNGAQASYVASAHSLLGVIYSRRGAPARALQEFEWCAAHASEVSIPKRNLYGWLAKVSDDLGLKADAERYDKLAREAELKG